MADMPRRDARPSAPSRPWVRWLLGVAVLAALGWMFTRGPAAPEAEAPDDAARAGSGAGFRRSLLDDDPGSTDGKAAGGESHESRMASTSARVSSAAHAAHGSVEGHVRSKADGSPVAGAELTFEHEGVVVSVVSTSDGQYRFEPARDGAWHLTTVSAQGFLPFAPEWGQNSVTVQAVAHRRITGATLWLEPAIEYTGLVLDGGGKPVAGADVRLFSSPTDAALMPLEDRFRSDARGEFRFRAPRDGVLEARHPRSGYGRARIDFAAEVSHKVQITLDASQRTPLGTEDISGHVVDTRGEPVAGAVITVQQDEPFEGHDVRLPSYATSDEEGHFRVSPLDEGRYRVSATHAELSPAHAANVAAGTHDVRLELARGGRVVGTVRSSDGAPVASYTLHLWQKTGPLTTYPLRSLSVLDAQGRFAVPGLPQGALMLSVDAPGFAPSQDLPFNITDEQSDVTLSVLLERGHRLTGVVSDTADKEPIAGARITLEGRGNDESAPTRNVVQSDAQGAFVIEGVRGGSASLFVTAEGHHARILGGITVPPAGPIHVDLRATEKDETPKLELAGLGLVLAAKDDALVVGGLAPRGGAAEAGMQVGDGIVAISGKPVTELGFEGAIAALRGPENTSVALSVRRNGNSEPVDMTVFRRLIRM